MKKVKLFIIGIVSMIALSVSAQEKITLVNIDYDLGFPTQIYTLKEIDSIISSPIIDEDNNVISTVADSIETLQLLDAFEKYGLDVACDGFWYQSVIRYLEAPEKAAEADEAGEYYNPQCSIYVPNDGSIAAIIFDWSSDRYMVAITTSNDNGYFLWVLCNPETLGEDWSIFRDTFGQFLIQ